MAKRRDIGTRSTALRDRRRVIAGLACLPLVNSGMASNPGSHAVVKKIGDADRAQFLEAICEVVVPATESPGAVEAGVPAYLAMMWHEGLLPSNLDNLIHEMDRLAGQRLVGAPYARKSAIISAVDAEAFGAASSGRLSEDLRVVWRSVKRQVLIGYYTSEVGASKELRYELVPRRYDADILLEDDAPAFSSDWRALMVS